MRILFGFVLLLLFAGNAHAEKADGYSRTEACEAATTSTEKAKQPAGKCSCYEFGEKIICQIVPLQQVLISEEEAPEVSEQLVTRPPVKETPLIPPPAPAATAGPEPSLIDSLIDWLKSFFRKGTVCDPANADCKPAPRVPVGGIKG